MTKEVVPSRADELSDEAASLAELHIKYKRVIWLNLFREVNICNESIHPAKCKLNGILNL